MVLRGAHPPELHIWWRREVLTLQFDKKYKIVIFAQTQQEMSNLSQAFIYRGADRTEETIVVRVYITTSTHSRLSSPIFTYEKVV